MNGESFSEHPTPPAPEPAIPRHPHPPAPPSSSPQGRNVLRIAFAAGAGCATVVVVTVLALVAAAVAIAIGMESGRFPDSAVQPRNRIPPRVVEFLRERGIVENDETVLYYYSAALFSFEKDGNLFTDRRVIAYEGYEGEISVYSATYDEIESFEFVDSDDWASDSRIIVYTEDEDWFVLLVSTEADGDEEFYDKLEQQWRRVSGVDDASAASR